MEYVTGDSVLIKNIKTQLKSQGIFDQIRKECIADVDTKPAYQNLCHRADTQVSKFLSKVKWGPDLHKNQTRENIRRQVNECNFVEPGIAIIIDQLVNPRINTVLVPKIEDMLYKYLGIPRKISNTPSQRETVSSNEKSSFRDISDDDVPGVSAVNIYDMKKDAEQYFCTNKYSKMDDRRNDFSTGKMQPSDDKCSRNESSSIEVEPFDNITDFGESTFYKSICDGRHDSSSSKISPIRKDDKSHHSRDHSKSSDHDRKSKSEYRKDGNKKDYKSEHKKDSARSDYKKYDDRSDSKKDEKNEHHKHSRTDHRKEDCRKHSSRDDKDKDHKNDPYRVSSSNDKKSSKSVKTEDSKHKYDKSREETKTSSKSVGIHKSEKKVDIPKKSRSQCNIDEKKKIDRRSSDRDSCGPSASNSSLNQQTSSQQSNRSERDKGSSKHRHSSSSSSSHKTKKNDSEYEKNRSQKLPNHEERSQTVEDDLELILESSSDKSFQNNTKSEANISACKTLPVKANGQSNDHIEDMMNEMFQPTKPVLKKPKIAKNVADIRRIMKLRKLYEEDFKAKSFEQNTNETATDADGSPEYKVKLRRTVDYFVRRRFGKNDNYKKYKQLSNAIIETLADVKLNIRRVDRQYSLIDGSCTLSDEETDRFFGNNIDRAANSNHKLCDNDEIYNIPIMVDEQANFILENLTDSSTDPNFKLGNVPEESKPNRLLVKPPLTEENIVKIVQCDIKGNGAKAPLPTQLTPQENDDKSEALDGRVPENKTATVVADEEDTSLLGLKLEIKTISDNKSKTWQACDQLEQIQDPVRCLPLPNYNSNFMQFANELLNESYNFEVGNLSIEMDYPEAYDFIFVDFLGAKVIRRKSDDPKTSPCKYNSEIISTKLGDRSIMLRIKKTSESDESVDQKMVDRKRKPADDSGIEMDVPESGNLNPEPVNKKRKTFGIKRTFVNPLKMKLTSGQLNDFVSNGSTAENTINAAAVKTEASPVPKKVFKVNKIREMNTANAFRERSQSESSDSRRSSLSSTGTSSTLSKGTNEPATHVLAAATSATAVAAVQPKNKTKNITLNNNTKTDTRETSTSKDAATTRTTDPLVKKANDTRTAEQRRKQSIMNCYYDESDLYKPRPSLRLTSKRQRLSNAENI